MDKRINSIILGLIILLALSFALGYFFGSSKSKTITLEKEKRIIEKDTVFVEKVKTKKFYIRLRDTLLLKQTDSIIVREPYIAEIDTVFKDSLYLNVKYYSPPENYFDIKYKLPNPYCDLPHLSKSRRFKLNYGVGILFGTKGIDAGIYVGISF